MADARGLGPRGVTLAGSSPVSPTKSAGITGDDWLAFINKLTRPDGRRGAGLFRCRAQHLDPAWEGLETVPVAFTNRSGKQVARWPDYWRQLGNLVDLAYDRYGRPGNSCICLKARAGSSSKGRIEPGP